METVLPILIPHTNNILLIKDQIGKTKSPTRLLPDSSFSYGKRIDRSEVGIKEITSDWQYGYTPNSKKKSREFKLPSMEFRFGLKNKPSTPMNRVINQSYAEEARSLLAEVYKKRTMSEHKKLDVHKNKCFNLRVELHMKRQEKDKELFKLKQFKAIEHKINFPHYQS